MVSQSTLPGLVMLMAVAGTAAAQTQGSLRWRAGAEPLGLHAGAEVRLPCASYTLACADAANLPLYASSTSTRSVSMQVSPSRPSVLSLAHPPGLDLSVVGTTGVLQDLDFYGRIGTASRRAGPALAAPTGESGLTYGFGFSWDFSRRASAALGLDSYDLRGMAGESRELRTSLGLQWRY
jgi:hypothetical protein